MARKPIAPGPHEELDLWIQGARQALDDHLLGRDPLRLEPLFEARSKRYRSTYGPIEYMNTIEHMILLDLLGATGSDRFRRTTTTQSGYTLP